MKKIIGLLYVMTSTAYAVDNNIWSAIAAHTINGEKEVAIVVPTYNNARHDICIKNIASLLDQQYENYHIYIINDCSTDESAEKIEAFLMSHPRADKVTLINNTKRVGAMANYYRMIHQLEDHLIILNVDGDDWLADPQVLSYINRIYDDEIWLTYGQYVEHPHGAIGFCAGYPKAVTKNNSFRKHGLPISHLRTYYAWLFKKIKKEDLMYEGAFVKATCDKVMMVPMVEMSGGRFRCIQDILYIYNAVNPLSDMRVCGHMQGAVRDKLFTMQPYEPLLEPIYDFATDVESA